jgi:HK97 family phage prohead protease
MKNYDFGGVATAYNVECKDGRTILPGAFDHQNEEIVPVVWRHRHDDIRNVLGHAMLMMSDTPHGMRVRAKLNHSAEGKKARMLVHGKDIVALSIWANELKETKEGDKRRVQHGRIREVSLVLAGQNPDAKIDDVVIHSEDPFNPDYVESDGVDIYTGIEIDEFVIHEDEIDVIEDEDAAGQEVEEVEEVEHEDDEDETVQDIFESLNEDQKSLFDVVLSAAFEGETNPKPTSTVGGEGPTVEEVYASLSEKQMTVLNYMAGIVGQDDDEESVSQGDNNMPTQIHNIFEKDADGNESEAFMAHEAVASALLQASHTRASSLREVFSQHEVTPLRLAMVIGSDPELESLSHSITNIANFFPNAKAVDSGGPQFYTNRQQEWVPGVLDATRKTPFSRIKSSYADLTADDARAKGYVTGDQKVEEVIVALERETTPTTVYKLQKLDRDNMLDITEFDVVVWLKSEMRMMLQEEVARAILIGDGRAAGPQKIAEANVRPIYNDDPTYTIDAIYNDVSNEQSYNDMTNDELIALIDYIAESMKDYRGAGTPTFYCQQGLAVKFMLIRDADNHRLHRSDADLAAALGVSRVVRVPVIDGMSRAGDVETMWLVWIGADRLRSLTILISTTTSIHTCTKPACLALWLTRSRPSLSRML